MATDPFILNCKMVYNDLEQVRQRVDRMWACAKDDRDMSLLEYVEFSLANLHIQIQNRLDN